MIFVLTYILIIWPSLCLSMLPTYSHLRIVGRSAFLASISSACHTPSMFLSMCKEPTQEKPYCVLRRGKSRLFKDGNPIIYGGAIENVFKEPQAGEEIEVFDHNFNIVGRGFFNPHSQYRVRLTVLKNEGRLFDMPLRSLFAARIERAKNLRSQVSLPSEKNTVYRLINGEGDRLGGLIIDVFGSVVVVQSSAIWAEVHSAVIVEALYENFGSANVRVIWRRASSRLIQDGFAKIDDEFPAQPESNTTIGPIIVVENGINYIVHPEGGQKTGFYCDQRDNRAIMKSICHGKDILDTYCYSGGFSLAAADGGAKSITAVDSSVAALAAAKENFKLNNFLNPVEFFQADALVVMKRLKDMGKMYDIVVCDPPKLAPSRSALMKARSKYVKINVAAMKLVRPGGLLLSFSCSAAVTQSNMLKEIIREAGVCLDRDVTFLSEMHAAKDHVVHASYKEGSYLSGVIACIS